MVCGPECLTVEKMAPFVNILKISFPFGIEFDIVKTIVELRLGPLLCACGIAHST